MSFYTGFMPAASNRADLNFQVELFDNVTNDTVDFTDAVITVALRPFGQNIPALVGTNLDGHIEVLFGVSAFEVRFSRAEMMQFPAGELDIGITVLLNDGVTYQLFAGQLPIIDGVVAA